VLVSTPQGELVLSLSKGDPRTPERRAISTVAAGGSYIMRISTTPATAAAMPERVVESLTFSLNFSMYGAPRKMNRMQGRKGKERARDEP